MQSLIEERQQVFDSAEDGYLAPAAEVEAEEADDDLQQPFVIMLDQDALDAMDVETAGAGQERLTEQAANEVIGDLVQAMTRGFREALRGDAAVAGNGNDGQAQEPRARDEQAAARRMESIVRALLSQKRVKDSKQQALPPTMANPKLRQAQAHQLLPKQEGHFVGSSTHQRLRDMYSQNYESEESSEAGEKGQKQGRSRDEL